MANKYNIYSNGEWVNSIVAEADYIDEYCEEDGYTYELIPEPEPQLQPEPMTQDEIETMLLDQEYRLLLLEYGLEEEEPI